MSARLGGSLLTERDNVLHVTGGCSCGWRVTYGAVSAGTFRSLGSNAGRFSGRLIAVSFVSVASVSVWEI